MRRLIDGAERHQIVLYLVAMAVGAALGLALPGAGAALEPAITPVLALLMYATFLGVPFSRIRHAVRDGRFLLAVCVLNFLAVPVLVFGLSRFVAGHEALLIGVLLVLLTPCVDYVIAFTGLAGGARERLLAATPLLMILQILLLPGYLWLMAGADAAAQVDPHPFLEAFLLLIVLPLALAALTQLLARRFAFARVVAQAVLAAMVPLMMLTLIVVIASQIFGVGGALTELLRVVPLFAAFAVIAVALGLLAGRIAGLDVPGRRAVVFSGVTRNSLVVLPLALALPFTLTPLVVVTQTLVELITMVVLVAIVPRLVPARGQAPSAPAP